MRYLHSTCALLLALAAHAAAQPAAAQPAATPTAYTVFLRGAPVGREEVVVQSDQGGTTVVTEGRVSAPADLVIRRAEFKYGPDWSPQSFQLDGIANGASLALRTTISGGTAVTQGTQAGTPIQVSHGISPNAHVHVNGIFGSYVALARRLNSAPAGTQIQMYVVPQAEIAVRVLEVADERMQLGADFIDVRRFELVFANPNGDLRAQLTADREGRLISVAIPAQAMTIMRADLAASTSRTQVYSNPGDEPVTIPGAGFNLGATLTRPANAKGALPAVILLSGSGANDRDAYALGVPVMGQLAGAVAEAGYLALRYDKRGHGQSGGRAESATLSDYAEDVRAIVRWLRERPDVDDKRIAVIGHSEGAWVALLAASRERRIAAVVTIAAPATSGAALILEQQQYALDQLNLPPAERERRVALQKAIQTAALTGKGWDEIPADMRAAADTPWFQSVLAFDPAKVLDDVRQPLLLLHGSLDKQVPVEHLDRLATLARDQSDSKSVAAVTLIGINHLLIPATTGDVSEYAALTDRNVSTEVGTQIRIWLTQTFAAIR